MPAEKPLRKASWMPLKLEFCSFVGKDTSEEKAPKSLGERGGGPQALPHFLRPGRMHRTSHWRKPPALRLSEVLPPLGHCLWDLEVRGTWREDMSAVGSGAQRTSSCIFVMKVRSGKLNHLLGQGHLFGEWRSQDFWILAIKFWPRNSWVLATNPSDCFTILPGLYPPPSHSYVENQFWSPGFHVAGAMSLKL